MGLYLINHVDPLCFTSEAAVLGLINRGQRPFEKEIRNRLFSSEYTSPVGFDDSHVVLNNLATTNGVTSYLMAIVHL